MKVITKRSHGEGTLPKPVHLTAFGREFANVLGCSQHLQEWQIYD